MISCSISKDNWKVLSKNASNKYIINNTQVVSERLHDFGSSANGKLFTFIYLKHHILSIFRQGHLISKGTYIDPAVETGLMSSDKYVLNSAIISLSVEPVPLAPVPSDIIITFWHKRVSLTTRSLEWISQRSGYFYLKFRPTFLLKGAGGSADLKISKSALLSLNHHNLSNSEPIYPN